MTRLHIYRDPENRQEVSVVGRGELGYAIPHKFRPQSTDPHHCDVCGFAYRPNDRPGYHEL